MVIHKGHFLCSGGGSSLTPPSRLARLDSTVIHSVSKMVFTEREQVMLGHREYDVYPVGMHHYQRWRSENQLGNELLTMNAYCLVYVEHFWLDPNPYEAHFILSTLLQAYDQASESDIEEQKTTR